jgi:RNA polymerase-binding transcription factor DksA
MLLVAIDDVYDEAEVAEIVERQARDAAVFDILKDMPEDRFDPNAVIDTDPTKECIECGELIPEARQRIVLTISKSCDYCAECQTYHEK